MTLRSESPVDRVNLLRCLDQNKVGTRLLFAGNLTRQPYCPERHYRVSGELKNTDIVMNVTFWIGIYPGLSEVMLDYAASQIESLYQKSLPMRTEKCFQNQQLRRFPRLTPEPVPPPQLTGVGIGISMPRKCMNTQGAFALITVRSMQ